MRTFTFFILIIIAYVFYITSSMGNTIVHEHIHQDIYESYNISSRVEYYFNKMYDPRQWNNPDRAIGRTFADKQCPTEACEIQHNVLEMVDYISQTIVSLLFFSALFILIAKYMLDVDADIRRFEKDLKELEAKAAKEFATELDTIFKNYGVYKKQ